MIHSTPAVPKKLAAAHAQAILAHLEKLPLSTAQKRTLLEILQKNLSPR